MTSCCSLGVNAFRTSVQIAAKQLSRPCTARRQLTPPVPSSQGFSAWIVLDRRRGLGPDITAPNRISFANSNTRTVRFSRTQIRTFRAKGHVVITNYVDLPPDYTDAAGLPFQRHDLAPAEVVKLFGSKMKTPAADKLLRILHGRRVAGTLEDPTLQVNTAMYSEKEKKIALAYLRRAVPVDEITNAGLRAEDELAALEGEEGEGEDNKTPGLLSERFNPYKKGTGKPEVYTKGVFDAIRAKNTAKWQERLRKQREEEEKRKKEEEEAAALLGGELETVGERRLGKVRTPSPSMQNWIDKAQSDLEQPPEMKKWERILPSAVAVTVFSGILVLWAVSYSPPRRADRLWPDIPPAAATVGALILANLAVYVAWKAPPLWGILNRYFLLVPATPRAISLFGASFSHQKITHLLANMVILWLVGTRLHDEIGRGDFLAVYFGSGAVGFLGSLMHLVLMNKLHFTSLGASGGVYGVMGAYFWMHRFEGFKLFGLPPEPYNGVPGMGFLGLLVGINIAAMFSRHHSVDIASHLVAMVAGITASRILEERREARRRAREEKSSMGGIPAKSVQKQSGRE